MQVQLGQSAYDSLQQVEEVLSLCASKEQKHALLTSLQQKLANYPVKLAEINKQLQAERTHIPANDTLESIVIKLREKTVQMDIATAEVATLEKV